MATPRHQTRTAPSAWASGTLPIILIFAAMFVGIAALLPLVQSSGATSTAGHIRVLEQQREDWQARLREKEVAVAELGSLDRIDKEARERLKMVPPVDVNYISIDAPAPAPHRLPGRFLPDQPNQTAAGDSLWEALTGWFPFP